MKNWQCDGEKLQQILHKSQKNCLILGVVYQISLNSVKQKSKLENFFGPIVDQSLNVTGPNYLKQIPKRFQRYQGTISILEKKVRKMGVQR